MPRFPMVVALAALSLGASAWGATVLVDEAPKPEIIQNNTEVTVVDTTEGAAPAEVYHGKKALKLSNDAAKPGWPSVRFVRPTSAEKGPTHLAAFDPEIHGLSIWYRSELDFKMTVRLFVYDAAAGNPVEVLTGALAKPLKPGEGWKQAWAKLEWTEQARRLDQGADRVWYIWLRATNHWGKTHTLYLDRIEWQVLPRDDEDDEKEGGEQDEG